MLRTIKKTILNYRDYGEIIVPKGIEVSHKTACGYDKNYFFVDDLSWVDKHNYSLIHDATYYGINIPKENVDDI